MEFQAPFERIMEECELLQYALEHGMINMSYVQEQIEMNERRELLDPTISEVFDEWNDRRLPICGDFLRLWEDFYEIYKIFNCK